MGSHSSGIFGSTYTKKNIRGISSEFHLYQSVAWANTDCAKKREGEREWDRRPNWKHFVAVEMSLCICANTKEFLHLLKKKKMETSITINKFVMWWDIVKTSWRWTAQHSRNDTKQKMEMINNKFQFNISCNMTNIQIIISIYVYVFFVGFQLLVATRFLHLTLSRWCVCVFFALSLWTLWLNISMPSF